MNIIIKSKNIELTAQLKEFIEKKYRRWKSILTFCKHLMIHHCRLKQRQL